MKQRCLLACLAGLLLVFLSLGCGGGGGSAGTSIASSWLGKSADPDANNQVAVDIRPSAVTLRPGQAISLAILVKNSMGYPLDGAEIQLASLLGGEFDEKTGKTEKGWFSTKFTAGSLVGTEAITALVNGKLESKSLLIQAVPASVPVVQIITSADSTLADTAINVAVGATIDGAPADGLNVLLSSTINGTFGDDAGSLSKGWFTTSFKPDAKAEGVGTITALIEGIIVKTSLSVVKQKKGVPQLKIAVNPDAVFQDQSAAVIVTATDGNGFPSSANVYLSSSLNGSFSSSNGTPEDGMFFTEFTAGKEVGSCTITVFSMDASASTVLSIERPVIVAKISPSSNRVKVEEKIPVSVLVTDSFARPISGTEVYLRADLGCTCSPENGNTNDDGYLFFELTAGDTAGTTVIRALTAGTNASASVTVFGP